MKPLYRLACLMFWFPLAAIAQPGVNTTSVEPFSVRMLNTYEVLNTPADLAFHPLMNVEVTFTAVVSGMATNTGLPGSQSPIVPGYPLRLHLFVVDTMGTELGNYGMAMQIVETLNEPMHVDMAPLLVSATRGTLMTFTGRLMSAVGQVQFDLTQMPVVVGHVDDPAFAHHRALLQPHFIHTFMANKVDTLTGALVPDMSMYPVLAHSYVTLGDVRFNRYSTPGAARPSWSVEDHFGGIFLYDSSSRFRNDRESMFWDIMNYRRAFSTEGPYTPPETGATGVVNGFVVYTSMSVMGSMMPTMATIAPWYDGVLWSGLNRSTPEWMPNDVVIQTVEPGITRNVEFNVGTASLSSSGFFNANIDRLFLRGSFTNWQPIGMDQVSPGYFRTTLSLEGLEGDSLEYKYYYERPNGAPAFNGGWEVLGDDPMRNRVLVLGAPDVDMTLNEQFSTGQAPVVTSRMITFSVDMSSLIGTGYFDPMQDSMVSIAGNFSGWGTLPMQRLTPTLWRTTVNMPGLAGDTIQYKFVYARSSGPVYNYGYEIIDERELYEGMYVNRQLVLGPADVPVVLDAVFFGYIPFMTPSEITFPVTFEQADFEIAAGVVGFEGGMLVRVPNPDKSALNPSDHVAMLIKGVGQPWAGAFFRMSEPIDPMHRIIRMKIWSPRADAKLLLKLENDTDPSQYVEVEQVIGVANSWTEVTFDLRHAPENQVYQKVVLISDLGTYGDGSMNHTFFLDNIRPGEPVQPNLLPVRLYTTSRFAPGDAEGNWLYIGLGDMDIPAVNLIGMGFRLWFDTTRVVPTAYTTLGMFNDGTDTDLLELFERLDSGVGVSVVRTSGTNKLPYGPVIGIRFLVKDDVEMIDVYIDEIEIRNDLGDPVPFHLRNYGISIPTRLMEIWPGDTNADGTVDVFDVEPIAFSFRTYGPSRQDRSIQWMPIEAPLWDVRELAHVDATGDGLINQNDLLPVGFNFGKSIPTVMGKELADLTTLRRPEAVDIPLPLMRAGEMLDIPLFADPTFSGVADLRAFAFRLEADASLIRIESVTPDAAFEVSGTLRMVKTETALNRTSAAFSRTRDMGGVTVDGALATVRIRALSDLPLGTSLAIGQSMTAYADSRSLPARFFTPDGSVTSVAPEVMLPSATRLDANYPNPFNPTTTLRYALSTSGRVRLAVYDVLGREVAILVDAEQSAGSYRMAFDAGLLSSGVYLVRLTVDAETYTQRITLVK